MCRAITNAYTHSEGNSDTAASSYTSAETVAPGRHVMVSVWRTGCPDTSQASICRWLTATKLKCWERAIQGRLRAYVLRFPDTGAITSAKSKYEIRQNFNHLVASLSAGAGSRWHCFWRGANMEGTHSQTTGEIRYAAGVYLPAGNFAANDLTVWRLSSVIR